MAKKSKGFRELYRQTTGKASRRQKSAAKLENSIRSQFDAVVTGPQRGQKMSDVLERFVEPYFDPKKPIEDYRALIMIAILAWNLSLIENTVEQDDKKAQLYTEAFKDNSPAELAEIKELFEALIVRKEENFSDNKRYIVNFELEDLDDEFFLSVASTLQP